MLRQVLYARLQTGAYVPGAGDLGTVLPSPSKTFDNFKMETDGNMLYISFTYRGITKELGIHQTNVVVNEFAPRDSSKPEAKKLSVAPTSGQQSAVA